MNPSSATASPLRQRMLDDMRMRNLAPKTQSAVRSLASINVSHSDWRRVHTASHKDA